MNTTLPQTPPERCSRNMSEIKKRILQSDKPGPLGVVDTENERIGALKVAFRNNIKVTTRKLENGAGYGVWRVE